MANTEKFSRIRRLAKGQGLRFEHHPNAYETEVVSCQAAALARGVPLSEELKHLVLCTSAGVTMVHLPGDQRLSLRKVKRVLSVKEAYLARPTDLEFDPGTVCPFVPHFWSQKHLVDESVLSLKAMTTNDATLHGFLRFDPRVILLADDVHVVEVLAQA